MTKIYEALENAGLERAGLDDRRGEAPVAHGRPLPPLPKSIEDKFLTLYRRLEAILDQSAGKIVEIAGVHAGDDGSRVLVAFAQFVATSLKKRVLLLAVGRHEYAGHNFAGDQALGWQRVLLEGAPIDGVIFPLGESGMSVSLLAPTDAAVTLFLDSPKLRETLDLLRERFDLILIDPPSFGSSPDGALLSAVTDGVVLVVESGKTRWQVIKHAMDEIGAQHGAVLGVILNKWHYYIPNLIYRMLP